MRPDPRAPGFRRRALHAMTGAGAVPRPRSPTPAVRPDRDRGAGPRSRPAAPRRARRPPRRGRRHRDPPPAASSSRCRCARAAGHDRPRPHRCVGPLVLRDRADARRAPVRRPGRSAPGVAGPAPGRPAQRLPLRARLVVRPRPVRPRLGCGGTLGRPARRREQVAAVRHQVTLRHSGRRSASRSSTAAPTSAAASTTSPRPPPQPCASTGTARSSPPLSARPGGSERQRELAASAPAAARRPSSPRRPPCARRAAAPAAAARRRAAARWRRRSPSRCRARRRSVRARVTVVQSSSRTLMAIVRPRAPCLQALRQLAREPAGPSPARPVGDVAVERGLVRARLRRPRLRSTVGAWKCARRSRGRGGRRSAAPAPPRRPAGARRSSCSPSAREPLCRLRADAGDDPRRLVRPGAGTPPRGPSRRTPRGFSRSLATLAMRRFGADADRIAMPVLRDVRDQLAQHAQRLLDPGQVGVPLVEPDAAGRGRAAARDELPDLARLRAVGREVGRDEDRLRAEPARRAAGAEPTPNLRAS